jgi:hypothetical protein
LPESDLLVLREDGARERELRRRSHHLHGLFQFVVFVDVDAENWTEYLLRHDLVEGIFGDDDRGLDEVAGAAPKRIRLVLCERRNGRHRPVVALAAADDLQVGRILRVVDVPFDPLERPLVDDRRGETVVVGGVADFQRAPDLQQTLLDLGPERLRHVHPGAGAALLAAELEGRPDGAVHHGGDVGAVVDEVVVLAAALADQAREVHVLVDVLADLGPQPGEGSAKAGRR